MNLDRIQSFMDAMVAHDIAELTVADGTSQVFLMRNRRTTSIAATGHRPLAQSLEAADSNNEAAPVMGQSPPDAVNTFVHAPMGGIFYASSTQGGAALVEVGSEIHSGDTLCVIEAMKMMNEVQAEQSARIVKVLCRSGDSVKPGQALFQTA